MAALGNDRWRASSPLPRSACYEYTVAAWVDRFLSWRHDLVRWTTSEDIAVALQPAPGSSKPPPRARAAPMDRELRAWAKELTGAGTPGTRRERALDAGFERAHRALSRPQPANRERAGAAGDGRPAACALQQLVRNVSARSAGRAARHLQRLRGAAALRRRAWASTCCTFRRSIRSASPGAREATTPPPRVRATRAARGRSARAKAATRPSTPSSARSRTSAGWSRAARAQGIEIALDIAFQCSPDHPYVTEHPEWFRQRPDGSVQYAENPPKKYEDIYPFDFETDDWRALWIELKSIFDHWIGEGVRIFRVDNPHTKPFAMWEWLIGEIKQRPSRRDLPLRSVHAPEDHAPAGQARLHAVLYLLHLAQHEGGADRVLHRARAVARRASISGPTPGRTRRTSCTPRCRAAGGPPSSRGSCSRRRWRRTTASTARRSS